MGCDMTTFVTQLKGKGFELKYIQDNGAVLSGAFAGKEDCTIYVLCSANTKQVWKVIVDFPKQSSWYSLKGQYNSLKESYTAKYGEPKSYEFFSSPYEEGDGYEMTAVGVEKCSYASFFKTTQCNIVLKIDKDKCVEVQYEDNINVGIWRREKQQAVSNDI